MPVNGYSGPTSSDSRHWYGGGKNRQDFNTSNADRRVLNGADTAPYQTKDVANEGSSSRASARFAGKHYSGSRVFNQGRRDWSGQSGSSYYQDHNHEEGAVGVDYGNKFYARDPPAFKPKDRNGNRDQSDNQVPDSHYEERSKLRDCKDQGNVRPQKKECIKSFPNRDFEQGKGRPKHWDRGYNAVREPVFYPDNATGENRYSERPKSHHVERGQDQDRYYSSRPNRRYVDRYQGGPREDYLRERSLASHDQDDRSYDRGFADRGDRFGLRGSRPQSDLKEDLYHQRAYSYQQGRHSAQYYNTQENFSSETSNFPLHDSNPREGTVYSSKPRENDQSPRPKATKSLNLRDGDDVSQRERLTDQLRRGTLECLVCCDRVRQQDSVWSCSNCFHVLHLRCVMKWAKSSKAETGWRCPACQNVTEKVPTQYRCFCEKILEPQWNRQDTPHTCGEVCGKSRESQRPVCVHRCNLLCHPGPCPPCLAQVTRKCGCGKTTQSVKCALGKPLVCESVCGKQLNCGVHSCEAICHPGPCNPCEQKIEQVCYCRKLKRDVDCVQENQGIFVFCCNEVCGAGLACGHHKCQDICHEEKCKPCQLAVDLITHCPCGQTELSQDPNEKRKSCLDPIPTCDKICNRKLPCGQPSNPHSCKSKCHPNACPPCPLTTMVRCRCGHMDRDLPCDQLTSKADDARCEKKCTKKRSCAKHKCNQLCCIEIDHPCPLPCNHMLSCGLHRCEQLCHRGHCQPCWRTSFDELYCECGSEVIYPPVPCGTKPPPCSRPCSRQHDCDHPALHPCHSETKCPPCSVLTQKYCYGNHELRKSIPCHQKEFSCGLPCSKELPCGRHKCIQICHKGECLGATCTQPCTVPRPTCQHPCSAPCHDGNCPDLPCKETVRVTCECGHRSAMRPCAENTKEYQRIATSLLASKMADVQLGHSIDIGDIMGTASTKKLYLKSLECNEECKVIERNRRMAIGLQIRNPDLSQKLTPRYSDFMRGWAKKDPVFCLYVHDKLTELVKLAKESKQKSRSYSFEVMNREKRQFVHEYCEHFGCESVAYDQEPKRNVVATAQKAKAWLPSVGLMELVQREAGQRKVPGPMLNAVKKPLSRTMDTLSNKWTAKLSTNSSTSCAPAPTTTNSALWSSSGVTSPPSSQSFDDGGSTSFSHIDHFNS